MEALKEGYDDSSAEEDGGEPLGPVELPPMEQLCVKPTELIARDMERKPDDVLLKYDPRDAQEIVPLYGPTKPAKTGHGVDTVTPWSLYRSRRNQELGHIIKPDDAAELAARATRGDSLDLKLPETVGPIVERNIGAGCITGELAVLHEQLWKEQRERDAKELAVKRLKVDRELQLPPVTNERVKDVGDSASETFLGPWAPFVGEAERSLRYEEIMHSEDAAEANAAHRITKGREDGAVVGLQSGDTSTLPNFTFHASAKTDYQGRSWILGPVAPPGRPAIASVFPRNVVHTYIGHKKAVLRQQFIPGDEHLLLSCSMDGTCKIWDVFNSKECMATYRGHSKGVKDLGFTSDGRRFYSCGMDSKILEWDTETGQVICTMGNGKLPFCLNVHPSGNHVLICGHQNKMAVQYDARTSEISQMYNEHLAAVNTATFCDQGRKIVTTADDKRMFVWEFGINVVMKHIAEPYMSSMPAATLDPKGESLALQSMDNQIVLYEAVNRFRLLNRRRFKGHVCSGFAIKPGFSPDSRFLCSGDVNGNLWIWDYESSKVIRSSQNSGHHGPIMAVNWNFKSASVLATAGWDGNIKLWN